MAGDDQSLEMPLPFGVSADTGQLLPPLTGADLQALAGAQRAPQAADEPLDNALDRRIRLEASPFGAVGDMDPGELADAGWGVIFAEQTPPAVKAALQPLLDRRRSEVGGGVFRVFEGPKAGYRAGDTAATWLARQGASLNVVNPLLGVPFYLLVVGSPEDIPFEFQYGLDIYWAVGRLHFDTAEEYGRYAKSVIAYEEAASPPTARRIVLFATAHDFDRATQLFNERVAKPLVEGSPTTSPLGRRQRFAMHALRGAEATKGALRDVLRGTGQGGRPSLVFSGSHGMGFGVDDPRLGATQGALVCQDWGGYGEIGEDAWLGAADVPPDAQMHGLIHMMFACYGGGCPMFDTYARGGPGHRQIAPRAMVAALPRALLAHPNGGALAVIAHVDRAWGYSFLSDRGVSQTQGFSDVIGRLLRGDRAGQALDQFNVRWAALSADLADALDDVK